MLGPDFFIVGAPKCGTTALAKLLNDHNEVQFSKEKEPHFFDYAYQEGINFYLKKYFSDSKEESIKGEATPSYLMIPYVPSRIYQEFGKVKIIVLLRDPVERAFSSWWMLYSRGMEHLNFRDAIKEDYEKSAIWKDPDLEKYWIDHINCLNKGQPLPLRTYLESGYYHKHIDRYFRYFGRDNVKIVFSDELQKNYEMTMSDILKFIGVKDFNSMPSFSRENEASGSGSIYFLRLSQKLGLQRIRRFFPNSLITFLKKGLSRIGEKPVLDSSMRSEVKKYFVDSNKELEQLLGIDLKRWL